MIISPPSALPVVVWTIAGSDSGGGAGIQADLKSFADLNVHGCSVLTAVTAQNTRHLHSVHALPASLIKQQLAVLEQEFPARAIKLGMLANAQLVDTVCDFLQCYRTADAAFTPWVVCDPVMSASVGGQLLDSAARQLLLQRLLPLVDIITPNIAELELLSQRQIKTLADVEQAALSLLDYGVAAVYVKGGHLDDYALAKAQGADFFCCAAHCQLVSAPRQFWLASDKLKRGAHGSGCRLAAALSAFLAHGQRLEDAVVMTKTYMANVLTRSFSLDTEQRLIPALNTLECQHLPRLYANAQALLAPICATQFAQCQTIGLYPVVDSVQWLERLLALGVRTIQLRLKNVSQPQLESDIERAVQLQQQYQAQLFINDYWQLAIRYAAYGVHLGQQDLATADVSRIAAAGLRLGVSTHSWWEIASAHTLKPSYIAIGPVFPTQTKQMPFAAQGLQQLAQWFNLLRSHYSIVAIGGINLSRARQIRALGIDGIALVSAITEAKDYRQVTQALLSMYD